MSVLRKPALTVDVASSPRGMSRLKSPSPRQYQCVRERVDQLFLLWMSKTQTQQRVLKKMDEIKRGSHIQQAPLSLAHMISDFYHGASAMNKNSPPRSPIRSYRGTSKTPEFNTPEASSGDEFSTTPDHTDSDSNNNSNKKQRSAHQSKSRVLKKRHSGDEATVDSKRSPRANETKLGFRSEEKHAEVDSKDSAEPRTSGQSSSGSVDEKHSDTASATKRSPLIRRRDSEQALVNSSIPRFFFSTKPTLVGKGRKKAASVPSDDAEQEELIRSTVDSAIRIRDNGDEEDNPTVDTSSSANDARICIPLQDFADVAGGLWNIPKPVRGILFNRIVEFEKHQRRRRKKKKRKKKKKDAAAAAAAAQAAAAATADPNSPRQHHSSSSDSEYDDALEYDGGDAAKWAVSNKSPSTNADANEAKHGDIEISLAAILGYWHEHLKGKTLAEKIFHILMPLDRQNAVRGCVDYMMANVPHNTDPTCNCLRVS